MHLDSGTSSQGSSKCPIPPWKLELLSRRSALARTVEPKLNEVLQSNSTETTQNSKMFTSWKELSLNSTNSSQIDGATQQPNSSSNFVYVRKRPLSPEQKIREITCATLSHSKFNGGASASNSVNPALSPSSTRGFVQASSSGSSVPLSASAVTPARLSPTAPLPPPRTLTSAAAAAAPLSSTSATNLVASKPAKRDLNIKIDSTKTNAPPVKRIENYPDQHSNNNWPLESKHRNRLSLHASIGSSGGHNKMGEDNSSIGSVQPEQVQDQQLHSDSDSSEEIHYGPGFVSRLKSRYMSAALKSSNHGTAMGMLRRTASLEDFLDKDKEEVSIELSTVVQTTAKSVSDHGATTRGRFQQRKSSSDERSGRNQTKKGSGGVANQVHKKARESMKRCQSVEVLSRNKLPEDSKPPPLPPKGVQHLENVLNSDSLSNSKITLIEKSPKSKDQQKPLSTNHHQINEATSATVIASLRRPFHYRRRSAGLLFGVAEKELPAPDTVKETRKIFEIHASSKPALIKSKSTSSLYKVSSSSPSSRSPERKKPSAAVRQTSLEPSMNHSTTKSLVNKKPALPTKPDLKSTSSKVATKYSSEGATKTSKNAIKTPTVASAKKPFVDKNKTFEVPPLRPVKGAPKDKDWTSASKHLPPIEIEEGIKIVSQDSIDKIRQGGESFSFNFKAKSEANHGATKEDNMLAKKPYLPLKQNALTNGNNPIPVLKSGGDTLDNASKNVQQQSSVPVGVIKPISRASADKSAVVAAAARPSADSVNNKSAVVAAAARPSADSVNNKSAVVTASARPSADHVSNKVTLRSTADTNKHQEERKATKTTSFAKKQDNRAASPTTTLNNLINLTNNGSSKSNNKSETKKENNKNQSNKKEVIVIDKKTELEPILKAPTQSHNTSKVANNHHTNKIVTFAEEIQIEHENQENKKSDNERLIHTPSPIKDNSDEGIDNLMLEEFDPETMDKSNYRDSWKKRQEAETKNTMVFNFLNSQKDVTHIENDGLDLSKRKKKQHMQQWSKVGINLILTLR